MEVTFNIKRLNPEATDPQPYFQEYTLDMDESQTVLDGLIRIREEMDGRIGYSRKIG